MFTIHILSRKRSFYPAVLDLFFKDFEACVKAIHEHEYSSPHLTAAIGTSAGGLPVAVLCNDTPKLVKAAVLKVYYYFHH